MSVLLAAPVHEWQSIRTSGIACPAGHASIKLFQDIGSIPTVPDRNHIIIWLNVLSLWQEGFAVHLRSSGTATCTGNENGITPTSQFTKVCWLSLTLWTSGIDLTTQAIASV